MQDTDWNDLRVVLAVSRGGTLAAAAAALAVDETTVARRLARLEGTLGVRLFRRERGRLVPSEAGRLAAEQAARSELEIEGLGERLRGLERSVAGRVRLTGVPLLVNRLLLPRLAPLLRAHPELSVEMVAEPADLRLTAREADVAVRLARPTGEGRLLARRVAWLDYGVYAGRGRTRRALPWIGYDEGMARLPQARWIAERVRKGEPAAPLRVNDAEGLLAALRAGLGRSLLPDCIAANEPGLRRLDDPLPPLRREVWLLVHPELRRLARIGAVVDWLEDCLRSATGRRSPGANPAGPAAAGRAPAG